MASAAAAPQRFVGGRVKKWFENPGDYFHGTVTAYDAKARW